MANSTFDLKKMKLPSLDELVTPDGVLIAKAKPRPPRRFKKKNSVLIPTAASNHEWDEDPEYDAISELLEPKAPLSTTAATTNTTNAPVSTGAETKGKTKTLAHDGRSEKGHTDKDKPSPDNDDVGTW
jgi:hypothetical protein